MNNKVIKFPDNRSYYRKEVERMYKEYCQNKKDNLSQRKQEKEIFRLGALVGASAATATLLAIKFLLN